MDEPEALRTLRGILEQTRQHLDYAIMQLALSTLRIHKALHPPHARRVRPALPEMQRRHLRAGAVRQRDVASILPPLLASDMFPQMPAKTFAVLDTRVIYCADNLDQLRKLPEACVDLVYIDPRFNSNRNYEVLWSNTREKRSFEDHRYASRARIDYMRAQCAGLRRGNHPDIHRLTQSFGVGGWAAVSSGGPAVRRSTRAAVT
jgi:hypothetical protein